MVSLRRATRTFAAAAATLVAVVCGGDADPAGTGASIQISVAPATLPVQLGASGSLTLSLARAGGFGGAVALMATGLPAGVTTTFTPAQLTGTAVTATVSVSVAAAVTPGTYTGTLTATGAGVDPATATYQLTVTAVPDYALSVAPSTLTIGPGGSGEATVNIQRSNFTGAVELELVSSPAGITGAFNPSAATSASILTVNVAASVASGSYPLTIQGTATGPGLRTTVLTVTVTEPSGYAISPSPAGLTVQRGSSAVVSITLARSNFTGAIDLAFENAPPGITGTFVPANTTGNKSVLTIDVGSGVAPGLYQLNLRGTATGLTDRVAAVALTVTATQAGGGNVEYQFCDPSLVPVFFAYQDGAGAWQPVTGFTSGATTTFAFNLTQGRGGVISVFRTTIANLLAVDPAAPARRLGLRASALRGGRSGVVRGPRATPMGAASLLTDVYLTEVLYGTTGELAQDGIDYCVLTQPTKTVQGTVAGVPFGQHAIVSLGSSARLFLSGSSPNPVTFTGVPSGRVDLVGTRIPTPGAAPDKAIVLRDLDIPDGGSLPASIDFNGSATSAPATATLTISGVSGDELEVFSEVVTANSHGLLWVDLTGSSATTRPWAGLAPGAMSSGDFHGISVLATPPSSTDGLRVALEFVGPVADQTVTFGPTLDVPTISQLATGDYPRFRFQGTLPPAYDKSASIDVLSSADTGNAFTILATGAYLAASGNPLAYDFTMPDVSGMADFPLAARLTAGTNVVSGGAIGFTGTGVFDLRPSLGSELRAATRSITINVP